MKKVLRFNSFEIVRLKNDHPEDNLKAGYCGLIWGIYDFEPPLYEASFIDQAGEIVDVMFHGEEVEEVANPQEAPCIDRLNELRRFLESCIAKSQ